MNKAEWDAMESRQRDEVVALNLMGWRKSVLQNIHAQLRPPGADECTIAMAPHYTTDRNACALVLEKLRADQGSWARFCDLMIMCAEVWDITSRAEEGGSTLNAGNIYEALGCWLCADPDFICYCTVKAVTDGKS